MVKVSLVTAALRVLQRVGLSHLELTERGLHGNC